MTKKIYTLTLSEADVLWLTVYLRKGIPEEETAEHYLKRIEIFRILFRGENHEQN